MRAKLCYTLKMSSSDGTIYDAQLTAEIDPSPSSDPIGTVNEAIPASSCHGFSPEFMREILASHIALSFSRGDTSNSWHEGSWWRGKAGGATLCSSSSTIELSGAGSRNLLLGQQEALRTGSLSSSCSQPSPLSRLSHGRGERTMNALLDTSCRVVEALSENPRHFGLADTLADNLIAVTHALSRKVCLVSVQSTVQIIMRRSSAH